MARTHPLTRPSTRRKLPSRRVASDQVQLPLLTPIQRAASGSAMPIKKTRTPTQLKSVITLRACRHAHPDRRLFLGLDNQHGIYRQPLLARGPALCRRADRGRVCEDPYLAEDQRGSNGTGDDAKAAPCAGKIARVSASRQSVDDRRFCPAGEEPAALCLDHYCPDLCRNRGHCGRAGDPGRADRAVRE
jgi:hypothetical protein